MFLFPLSINSKKFLNRKILELYACIQFMHIHLSFNSMLFIFLVCTDFGADKLMCMSVLIRFHHIWKKETSL